MKIAILTHNISVYNQQKFSHLAKMRGHELHFIHLSYCYANISEKSPTVYYQNNDIIQNLKAIIPRIHAKHSFYGMALLRQFERSGVYTLNNSIAINWSMDRLRCLQLLAKKSFPLPVTGFADSPEETSKLIELVGGAPLIIRLIEGSEGKGTIFAETHQAAISVINAFKQIKANILVQEYIQESAGSDIRVLVIGNKVIGCMQRSAKEAGFRARYRFLTHSHPVTITNEEKKMMVKALRALKLNFATIDFIRSKRGPLILDLDPSPNIEALEKILKVDIMTPIFKFLEENVRIHD